MVRTNGRAPACATEFAPAKDYLRVEITGELPNLPDRFACWRAIVERCRADGREKVLVVQDSPSVIGTLEMYELTEFVIGLGIAGLKIAFVDLHSPDFSVVEFGETVGKNRGAFSKVSGD